MNPIEMKILIGLHRNVNAIDKKSFAIISEYGLTMGQFGILEALYTKGKLTVGQARDSILSSVGTIPMIVNNLVKSGYVKRETDEKDRRVCILDLTEKGKLLIEEVAPKNTISVIDSMKRLEQTEKEELLRLLKKMSGRTDSYHVIER